MEDLSAEETKKIEENGFYELRSNYIDDLRIPISTMEDMKKNLVLNADFIPISCPVRLLHGMKDDTIPYQTSFTCCRKIN